MSNSTTFDTVSMELDHEEIVNMNAIKRTLKSCLDMNLLIKEMSEIIDKSKNFEFRSERTKKFINAKDPTFILKCKLLDEFKNLNPKDVNKLNPNKVSKLADEITELAVKEIINKTADFTTECIIDEDKFNTLFKNLPEELSSSFLSMIYSVRISVVDNSVVIKIFD